MVDWVSHATGTNAGSQARVGGDIGANITSATTITVSDFVHNVSGSAAIATISGGIAGSEYTLIPAAASTWTLATSGNINEAVTATVGVPVRLLYDGTTYRVLSGGGVGITQAAADTRYVNVSGDTMTGNLTAPAVAINGTTSPTTYLTTTKSGDTQYDVGYHGLPSRLLVLDGNGTTAEGKAVVHIERNGTGPARNGAVGTLTVVDSGVDGGETFSPLIRMTTAAADALGGTAIYARTHRLTAPTFGASAVLNSDFGAAINVQTFGYSAITGIETNNFIDGTADALRVHDDFNDANNFFHNMSLGNAVISSAGSRRHTAAFYVGSQSGLATAWYRGVSVKSDAGVPGQAVRKATVTAGGSGYTSATVAFSGGDPTVAATGSVVVSGGAVTHVRILTSGYGYKAAPTLTINGDGSSATATAVMTHCSSFHSDADNLGLDVKGGVATAVKYVTAANGANNNLDIGTAGYVQLTGPTGAFSVTGFYGGGGGVTGGAVTGRNRLLVVVNNTAQQMTLVNQSGSSSVGNKITTLTGADVVLRAGTSAAIFIYDIAGVDGSWFLLSYN